MTQDRGPWLSTATALFLSWAFLSLGVRGWVVLSKKLSWGHSDTAAVAAFTLVVLHVAATFRAIHDGYGRPLRELTETKVDDMEKALFTSQLSYIGAIGLTRVSTAFFIGQLTRHLAQVRMSYIFATVTGVWTVASILVIALRPKIAHPWATLDGTETLFVRWSAVEATGLAVEVALWMFSISLIWGLQMKTRKRTLILITFGCRLLLIPIITLRLIYLSPGENHEPTRTNILSHILTEGALEYAIVSTSITTLKPFLKTFHTGTIVNSVGGGGSALDSGPRLGTQDIYMLSSITRNRKDPDLTTTSTVRSTKSNSWTQPRAKIYTGKTVDGTTTVSSPPNPHQDDLDSVESNGSEQMIIRTTKQWTVRYEDQA